MRKKLSLTVAILMMSTIMIGITNLESSEATGNETISITLNNGNHFDDGETVTFTINLGDLDPNLGYQLEWRLCSNSLWNYDPGDDGDWVDGDCNVFEYNAWYDDMQNGVSFSPDSQNSHVG